ncbi:MAG: RDD family protein [Myxococcaceae bacterium]
MAESHLSPPYPKASLWLRGGARLVDLTIAWSGLFLGLRPGCVFGIVFVLLADGLLSGQSPGKRIFGVKVMHLPSRGAARTRDSVLRNAPFALMFFLGLMPELGAKALVLGGLVLFVAEGVRCVRDPLGHRWGDILADTQVVDGKVVAGAQAVARPPAAAADPGRAMRVPHPARPHSQPGAVACELR